jgi:hypothetical protein
MPNLPTQQKGLFLNPDRSRHVKPVNAIKSIIKINGLLPTHYFPCSRQGHVAHPTSVF